MPSEQDSVTFRAPREFTQRVRELAEREHESHSTILRRLLRRGLEIEQRAAQVSR